MMHLAFLALGVTTPRTAMPRTTTATTPRAAVPRTTTPTMKASPPPDALLSRYLQLREYLSGEPLSDERVAGLVRRAESEAAPVTFDEAKIWGDWQLVWQLNTKKATRSQKALAPLPQFSNFLTDEKDRNVFRNIVQLTRNRVRVVADVEYTPEPAVAGRLNSTICAASIQIKLGRRFGWKPLRIPLPLKGEGWLDVTYLSDEMRITRGNRGGIFVHLRPDQLTRSAVWPSIGGGGGVHRMAGRRAAKPAPPPAPPPAEKVFSWYDRGIRL